MVHKLKAEIKVCPDDPQRGLLFVDGRYMAGGDKEMMRGILKRIKSGVSASDALKERGLI